MMLLRTNNFRTNCRIFNIPIYFNCFRLFVSRTLSGKILNARYVISTNIINADKNNFKKSTLISSYVTSPKFQRCHFTDLQENSLLETLISHNVSKENLEKYEIYLKDPSATTKVDLLIKISNNISDLLPLLALPVSVLKLIAKRSSKDATVKQSFDDRLLYLCHHLELSVNEVINLLQTHNCLLTMTFQKLETKMQLLKDAGINSQDLAKDLWIFNYHEKWLTDRVSIARDAELPFKPWLLRCSTKYLLRFVSNWKETQRVLAGDNLVGYLSKTLNCSSDYVEHLMKRNSLLHTTNVIKLKKVNDFLLGKGYTPEEIRLFPKIYCSSVETLTKRYEQFSQIRGTIPTLPQLSISRIFKKSVKTVDQ